MQNVVINMREKFHYDRLRNDRAIAVGDGGRGGGTCPPPSKKIGKKYFSGNYDVKVGHISGKNRVKFGNFVNFWGQIS